MTNANWPKVATIVGSDKGGVGKSMISSLLIDAYDQARRRLTVVEIDHQGKLTSLMQGRVDLSLGASADLKDISTNKLAAERHYNSVYDRWAEQDSLTDLGANVTTFLFNWMRQCSIAELAKEDGIHFRFIVVATPDDQALQSAFTALNNATGAMGADAEYFLVMNEISPGTGFEHYRDHQIYADLMALVDRIGLSIVTIPFCDSELMEFGRSRSLTALSVFLNRDRLVAEMNLNRVAARTEKKRMLEWITAVQDELKPLFAAPPRAYQPAPRMGEPEQRQAASAPVRRDAPFEPRFTEAADPVCDQRPLAVDGFRGAAAAPRFDQFAPEIAEPMHQMDSYLRPSDGRMQDRFDGGAKLHALDRRG